MYREYNVHLEIAAIHLLFKRQIFLKYWMATGKAFSHPDSFLLTRINHPWSGFNPTLSCL